jgi:hypothetical protein
MTKAIHTSPFWVIMGDFFSSLTISLGHDRIGSKTETEIRSLKTVDASYRAVDRQKIAPVKREVKSSGDCAVI